MKQQNGLSLISTLIVAAILMALLVLGFRMVPVFSEYFAIKNAFTKIVSNTDPSASPNVFRTAFSRQTQIDDIRSIDPQTISVTRDSGVVTLQVSYRRELPLFANVGLYFDFDISSGN